MWRKNLIKAEINEIVNKHPIQKINDSKSLFFEKINRFNKPLARIMKKKRIKTQITNIWLKEGIATQELQKSKGILGNITNNL